MNMIIYSLFRQKRMSSGFRPGTDIRNPEADSYGRRLDMKKRNVLLWILALTMVFGLLASAQAAVTTADSGPAVGKHTAQHYILDCGTQVVINEATGEQVTKDGVNGLPLLYPGDTVYFSTEMDETGYVFVNSNGDYIASGTPGADGQEHVHVLETSPFPKYTIVTKIQIVGNELVQLNKGTFSSYPGGDGKYYSVQVLKYRYVPLWCDIHTEIWFQFNADHHQMSAAELATAAYYTDEESSTRAWAEDSITNGNSQTQKEVLLTLRRPYIEGRYFAGISFDPGKGAHNQISNEYKIYEGEGWHGNYWEGWMDNQVEVHPALKKVSPGDYTGAGSYDDELLVRFKYGYGRTVTFDACGGTIDGYPSRIYEATGKQYFNGDLQSGKVDEEFAAGTAYVPQWEGYHFDGWFEDAAYTKPVESIKDTVNKYTDATYVSDDERICRIYAKWTAYVSVNSCKVGKIKDQVYTGKKITPEPVVTYQGKTLEKDTDYTVSYENNTNIGKAAVVLEGKGIYTGTRKIPFVINPRGMKLSSLKAGKSLLTVKWKKDSKIDGYEIQYGLKKNFKGAKKVTVSKAKTTSTTLKKLKSGKTYYVRIRSYKKVSGKTYYSAWSKALSKKVK